MPTYSFRCSTCNDDFDNFQSMSDASIPACRRCASSDSVTKLMKFGGILPTATRRDRERPHSSKPPEAEPLVGPVAMQITNSSNVDIEGLYSDGAIVFDDSSGSIKNSEFVGPNALVVRGDSDVTADGIHHHPK